MKTGDRDVERPSPERVGLREDLGGTNPAFCWTCLIVLLNR